MNRRTFVKSLPMITGGIALGNMSFGKEILPTGKEMCGKSVFKPKIHIFSKHLQWLNYRDMASFVTELGIDGIDLSVRNNGHVLPENVKRDLPEAVRIIRDHGLIIDRITSRITDAQEKTTHEILETAATLGIKYYRLGYYRYNKDCSIEKNLGKFTEALSEIVELNKQYGITAAYQNHAGARILGASIWDVGRIINEINSKYLGMQFDIRHAVVEGGQSWPMDFEYVKKHINGLILKDFKWSDMSGTSKIQNVPLGEGVVDYKRYISLLNESNISCDLTLHFEYDSLGGAEHGRKDISISRCQAKQIFMKDIIQLREWLK